MSAATRAAWTAAWQSTRLAVYAALAFVAGTVTYFVWLAP